MITTEIGEYKELPANSRLWNLEQVLKDDEALIVFLTNGRMVVLADTNVNGGVCDDCKTDFYNEEIAGYHLMKVKKS